MTSAKDVVLFRKDHDGESSFRRFSFAYVRLLRSRSQARGLLPSGAPEAHPIKRRTRSQRFWERLRRTRRKHKGEAEGFHRQSMKAYTSRIRKDLEYRIRAQGLEFE